MSTGAAFIASLFADAIVPKFGGNSPYDVDQSVHLLQYATTCEMMIHIYVVCILHLWHRRIRQDLEKALSRLRAVTYCIHVHAEER